MTASRKPSRTDGVKKLLERRLESDEKCRALTEAVRGAQAKLRRATTDEAWELYLALEEHVNARHAEIVAITIDLAVRKRRG
jgi:hypothetical protein